MENTQCFFLMLNCLVFTRANRDLKGSDNRFESETNGYFGSLIKAFADPSRIEHLKPYLSDQDIEMFRRFEHSGSASLRYTICKSDTDLLVFGVGMFDSAGEKSLPMGPEFSHGHQGQMGRGPTQYHFAFSYSRKVSEIPGTIGTILQLLSKGFEKYATILTYGCGEYFDIAKRLSGGEIHHLKRSVEAAGKQVQCENQQHQINKPIQPNGA